MQTVLLSLILVAGAAAGQSGDRQERTTPAESAAADLPFWYELPSSMRRDLPDLDVTVYYYNQDPDERFIKMNEVRFMEGESMGPELWLREIRREGLVLEFRGRRFLVPR